MKRAESKPIHVVFLVRSFGFPEGMAATTRARLIARNLVSSGIGVTVLCTQVSELPADVENPAVSGCYEGIQFEYTTGRTTRSNSFLVRRLVDARGLLVAAWRLWRIRRRATAALYWLGDSQEPTFSRLFFFSLAVLLGVPVVLELNERPWSLRSESFFGKRLSPLRGIDAVVAISSFLVRWAEEEAARLNRRIPILTVPVLTDVDEVRPGNAAPEHYVMFAGSPAYEQTIRFVLDAMDHVWRVYPSCRLVISGSRPSEGRAEWLRSEIARRCQQKIHFLGYVARSELLRYLLNASALLIPLFDDTVSRARFPSKLAEYLAAARPVVTSDVGDISTFLQDGVSAFIARAADASDFARQIIRVLSDPDEATRVAKSGRAVAETAFSHVSQAGAVSEFFSRVARPPQPPFQGGSSGIARSGERCD